MNKIYISNSRFDDRYDGSDWSKKHSPVDQTMSTSIMVNNKNNLDKGETFLNSQIVLLLPSRGTVHTGSECRYIQIN